LAIVNNRRCAVLSVLFLGFCFSALRFDAGYDYPVYYQFAAGIGNVHFEPLVDLIGFFSRLLHPQVFFVLTSFLVVYFFYKSYSFVEFACGCSRIAILIFCFAPIGLLLSMGIIRQMLSAYMIMYAVLLSANRQTGHAHFIALLAVLTHESAFIAFPIIWLRPVLSTRIPIIFLWLFLLASPLMLGLIKIFSKLTGLYYGYFFSELSDIGYKMYLLFLLIFLSFNFFLKEIRDSIIINHLFNFFFIGLFFYTALLPLGMHLQRLAWSMMISYPLIIGYLLTKSHSLYRALAVLITFFLLLISLYLANAEPARDSLNRYRLFFNVSDDYSVMSMDGAQ